MMRRALTVALIAATMLMIPAAATAGGYSDNSRVATHLSKHRECRGLDTRYEVVLVNRMPKARRFHAVTTVKGARMSDVRYRIPGHARVGVILSVPSARELMLTVRFRGEVLLQRRLAGICHY